MTLKTYSGSCHCGAVRFEADLDLSPGDHKMQLFKLRQSAIVAGRSPAPIAFGLSPAQESQAVYQWTPPGRAAPNFQYHFCKNCGIRTPSRGVAEALGGAFHAVQVTLLDDVDPDELARAPIQYVDGRNDHFDRPPADTRLL